MNSFSDFVDGTLALGLLWIWMVYCRSCMEATFI